MSLTTKHQIFYPDTNDSALAKTHMTRLAETADAALSAHQASVGVEIEKYKKNATETLTAHLDVRIDAERKHQDANMATVRERLAIQDGVIEAAEQRATEQISQAEQRGRGYTDQEVNTAKGELNASIGQVRQQHTELSGELDETKVRLEEVALEASRKIVIPDGGGGSAVVIANEDGTSTVAGTTSARVPVLNTQHRFEGKAVEAVQDASARVVFGRTFNVCSPLFGADHTGVKDSTAAIQAAIDRANSEGGGTVEIPAGDFRISPPFLEIKGYVHITGAGVGATRLIIDQSKVTADQEETGAIHTGTFNRRKDDPSLFRTGISHLTIMTSRKDGTINRYATSGPLHHIPAAEMSDKVWGIVYNTHLGSGPAEPDSVHTVNNIEIWNTAGGFALIGLDDQGCKFSNIRIRRTWKQGVLVGKPYNHPEAYEPNPNDVNKPYRRYGAADNHFTDIDASSANMGLGGYAVFEVYTSQCCFTQCKAWYSKRGSAGAVSDPLGTLPTGDERNIWNLTATTETAVAGQANERSEARRFIKDGAGFWVAGRDNVFHGCTSQETGGHGWVIHGSCNILSGCFGESPGYYDTISQDARLNEAVGFFVTNWSWGTQLTGCISKNAYRNHKDSRAGFYVQPWAGRLTLRDCKAYDMPLVNPAQVDGPTMDYLFPPANRLGETVTLQVNNYSWTNIPQVLPTSSATDGGELPTAPAIIPTEVGSVVAHWDFSDASTITAADGKVSAVAPVTASAPDATLRQAEVANRPAVSSLGGRGAIKTTRGSSQFIKAANIGETPVTSGWSIAMVVALNEAQDGQYVYSSYGAGSSNPASVLANKAMSLRTNSGGGSKGYTVKTPDKALALYTPAVVVTTVDGTTMRTYTNGALSTEEPVATGAMSALAGSATLGAYNSGTNGYVSATLGEVALFGVALTPEQVAGLTAHLTKKWL